MVLSGHRAGALEGRGRCLQSVTRCESERGMAYVSCVLTGSGVLEPASVQEWLMARKGGDSSILGSVHVDTSSLRGYIDTSTDSGERLECEPDLRCGWHRPGHIVCESRPPRVNLSRKLVTAI